MQPVNLKKSGLDTSASINEADVRDALESVLAGAEFQGSPKLFAFLEHIVEVTLAGKADTIKGTSIARDVLGRKRDFNPGKDAVVRVHASRMRQALDQYYAGDGADDPVIISVPKGSYVPAFARRETPSDIPESGADLSPDHPQRPETQPAPDSRPGRWFRRPRPAVMVLASLLIAVVAMSAGFWLSTTIRNSQAEGSPPPINTVAVLPIERTFGGLDSRNMADALTMGIVGALERGGFLSVILAEPQPEKGWNRVIGLSENLRARFVLTGTMIPLGSAGDDSRLTLSLVDGVSGFTVWNAQYEVGLLDDRDGYDALLRRISYDLGPAYYLAVDTVLDDAGARELSPVELFLRASQIPGMTALSLQEETERLALARDALASTPDDGMAHSALAEMLSHLALVDPPSDTPEAREQAAFHADRAMAFAGRKAKAVLNVGLTERALGDAAAATRHMHRAAELDPGNAVATLMVRHLPYRCRPSPAAHRRAVIALHNSLGPVNPVRAITASALADIYLNQRDYARAERWAKEAEEQSRSLTIAYQHAAALVQLGKAPEARQIVERQRSRWPNLDVHHFADRAIPRLCAGDASEGHLQELYRALANELAPEGSTWRELPM